MSEHNSSDSRRDPRRPSRRWRRTALIGTSLVLGTSALALAPPAAAETAETIRQPGAVLASDRIGQLDVVTFYLPDSVGFGAARRQIAAAAANRHLPNRGIRRRDANADEPARLLELSTTIGHRDGRLGRTVDAGVVAGLDVWRKGAVFLRLPKTAHVLSGPSGARGGRWLAVEVSGEIVYRLPVSILLIPFGVAVGLLVVPFAFLTPYARAVERRTLSEADKLHRVGRFGGIVVGLALVAAYFALASTDAVNAPILAVEATSPTLSGWRVVDVMAPLILFGALVIVAMISVLLALHPFERRLRDLEQTRRQAVRGLLRVLTFVMVPVVIWITALNAAPESVSSSPLASALLRIGLVFTLGALGPAIVLSMVRSYPLETEARDRMLGFCGRFGLRVRDVRRYQGRAQKLANAMFVGTLPSHRYVLISDYLLDTFGPDEIDAVLAHEVAHGKQHHLLVRAGGYAALVMVALLPFGELVVVPGFVYWLFGLRRLLERRADDFAVDCVGLDPTVRALEKLAAVNTVRRKRGRVANLLGSHPDIERRVRRLRQRAAVGSLNDRGA